VTRTLLAAPDKYRGTATAAQAAAAMRRGADQAGWLSVALPISDGGEGLIDCFGGPNRVSTITDPFGQPVDAPWRLDGDTAVVEMSAASGIKLTTPANDPVKASTIGTGELIAHAIAAGAHHIIVGAGGSATTDGGYGAIAELQALAPLDGSRGYRIVVAVDVDTPFLSAATTFAAQKGADRGQITYLETRLRELADNYTHRFHRDISSLAGGGAAGGLAGGLAALGAHIQPGFDLVADHLNLDPHIAAADFVITGEGKLDRTSVLGKAPWATTNRCHQLHKPVAMIAGTVDPGLDLTTPVISLADHFGYAAALGDTQRCLEQATTMLLHAYGDTRHSSPGPPNRTIDHRARRT
jgi:glycerate kinase